MHPHPKGACREGLSLTPHTYDIVLPVPNVYINRIENCKQWEAPGNSVNNYAFSLREELINNSPEQEEMDERPVFEVN